MGMLKSYTGRQKGLRFALVLGALAAATCGLGVANAATVTTTYEGVRSGTLAVHVSFNNTRDSAVGYQNHYVYAGQLNWKNSTGNGFSVPSSFYSYCIEFTQNVLTSGPTTFDVDSLASAPKPYGNPPGNPGNGMGAENGLGTSRTKDTLIRQLWSNYSTAAAASSLASAAFQLAIWKIIYEDSTTVAHFTNIADGNFKYIDGDSNVISTTNSYLSWLTDSANASANQTPGLVAFTNSTYQDQIFNDTTGDNPTFGSTPVPLPVSAAMGGSLFALMLTRRNRLA